MALNLISVDDDLLVTLQEAKDFIGLSFNHDDALVEGCIRTATELAERETGRSFRETVWEETFKHWKCWMLSRAPVLEVEEIRYFDTDNVERDLASSNYIVVRPTFQLGQVWFPRDVSLPSVYCRPDAITVKYTAGYTQQPAMARQAIKVLAKWFYMDRTGKDVENGIDRLLDRLRVHGTL
jgi:uncharacterized phiE125 gp8 family phage protein